MHGSVTILVLALAAAAVLYGAVRYFEWSNLYHPVRALAATPESAGLAYEEVSFVAEDDTTLHGWWIPHPRARGAVVFCHGNGENIGHLVDTARALHGLGLSVFLFDYRGYGRSRGVPTEQGTYRDARAAYECVRSRYGDEERPPVIAWGRSLGGAVVVQLALDRPLRGLVVESAFASTVAIGRALFPSLPVESFCRYRYDSLSKMPRVGCPVLVAHGRGDEVVPFEQARALYDAAREPKRFVELRGGHNDGGAAACEEGLAAVRAFLDLALPPPPRAPREG